MCAAAALAKLHSTQHFPAQACIQAKTSRISSICRQLWRENEAWTPTTRQSSHKGQSLRQLWATDLISCILVSQTLTLKNSFYYLSYKAHLKGLVFWSRLFQYSISDHFLSMLDLLYVIHLPYFLWAYFLSIFPPSVVVSQCFRTPWALGQHCWLTLTS